MVQDVSRVGKRRWLLGGVLLLILMAGVGNEVRQRILWNRTISPVREAIFSASHEGFRYPTANLTGGEIVSPRTQGDSAAAMEESLAILRARFAEDAYSADLAYWLGAGLTVTGRLEEARPVLDIGRVQNPEDVRLWILDAILAVREGKALESQQILQRLLEREPDNAVARYNLDLLLPRE